MRVKCPFCGALNTRDTRRGYWRCHSLACYRKFTENDVKVRNTLKKVDVERLLNQGYSLRDVADKYRVEIKIIEKVLGVTSFNR